MCCKFRVIYFSGKCHWSQSTAGRLYRLYTFSIMSLMCSNFYFQKEGIAQLCGCLYIQMLSTLQWFQGNTLKCKAVFYTPHTFFCKTRAVASHQVHTASMHHQILKADTCTKRACEVWINVTLNTRNVRTPRPVPMLMRTEVWSSRASQNWVKTQCWSVSNRLK